MDNTSTEFSDKVVLVTGASSGIGAAVAAAFAARGASVALAGRHRARLAAAAAACRKANPRAHTLIITADFKKNDEVQGAVDKTVEVFGGLDVLVNGVGVGAASKFSDADALEVFEDVLRTNLTCHAACSHRALPHLTARRGCIVNISSICATRVVPLASLPYCVAKAGLDHLTRCLAAELGPRGVRVNSVNPGPVRTPFWDYASAAGDPMKAVAATVPLRRVSEPEEVADMVLYLASERARGITGSNFVVDNGYKVAT